MPVLTCQKATSSITWFMLGQIPGFTDITLTGLPLPEATSRAAINTALTAMHRRPSQTGTGFLAWSLQNQDEPPITGGSLGLPFALGLLLLQDGLPWPDKVYASGGIADDGRILSVGQETEKYLHVHQQMRALILPETGLAEASMEPRVIRCGSLEQAYFMLNCVHRSLDVDRIQQYRACLNDPQLFLTQFATLPVALLSFADGRRLMARIKADRQPLIQPLSRCLARCSNDTERAGLLADLFTPEDIRRIVDEENQGEEFAAHQWCVSKIAYNNRSGAVADNDDWLNLAEDLRVRVTDDEIANFFNHSFVATRFNRYDFRPEPPEEFAQFLTLEEKLYQIKPADSRPLGAMYGTLAQNYGFCGSQWRQELERYAKKAEIAFGRKFHRERLRIMAYRIYGLIDAGLYDEAAFLLNDYIGSPLSNGPEQWVATICRLNRQPSEHTPFQTAITCRLLADLAICQHTVLPGQLLMRLLDCLPVMLSHPWQLTTYNLGRLFLATGLRPQAENLLRRSLAACLQGGETMRTMALLPLAAMNSHGMAYPEHESVCTEILVAIKASPHLNQNHFQPLVEALSPVQALQEVALHYQRYFPFSYR